MQAWSLYTAEGSSPYAGHDGYDDALGSRYSYDSAVPNHLRVKPGDLIILRDGSGSQGAGFVEEIAVTEGLKTRKRCPSCGTSQLEERTQIHPRFRCTHGHTFEAPTITSDPVTIYRAEYGRSFLECTPLSSVALESLSIARSRQNAIRELDLDRTLSVLRDNDVFPLLGEFGAGCRIDEE